MRNPFRHFTLGLVDNRAFGPALQLLSGFVTAPSTTQTPLTMASGDSTTIKNTNGGTLAYLLTCWVDAQLRGILRIKSPAQHDNVQGLRFATNASEVQPLFDPMFATPLQGGEALTIDLSGSATGGDLESFGGLVRYDDLPGANARLIDVAALKSRMIRLVTVENSLATGTGGGYSGEEAINADFDLLKANVDYALVGYTIAPVAGQTDGECCSIGWRGPDTSNLRVGGPGSDTDKHLTHRWFAWLSERCGKPCIPIINSGNRAGTLVDAVQDENGLDVIVSSILCELK